MSCCESPRAQPEIQAPFLREPARRLHAVFAQPAGFSAPLPLLSLFSLAVTEGDPPSPGRPLGATLKPKRGQGELKVIGGRERPRRGRRAGGLAGWRTGRQAAAARVGAVGSGAFQAQLGAGSDPSPGLPPCPLPFPSLRLGMRGRAQSPGRLNYSSLICPQLPPFHTGNASSPGA